VVIYSDGITEAADARDEQFGVDRLKTLVAAHADLPARALVELSVHKVEAFSGRARPIDDQTVMVIRRPPGPSPF
jgi:serine phosphatase RsbU (regulator of sigma subunit)